MPGAAVAAPSSFCIFCCSSWIRLELPLAVAARPSSTAPTLAYSTSSDTGFSCTFASDSSRIRMRSVISLRFASTAMVPPAAAAPGVRAMVSRSSTICFWSSGTAAASFCTCAAS